MTGSPTSRGVARPGTPGCDPGCADEGSGVADFVLVTLLVLALLLLVVQVGLALHTRNLLVAAASEGARYGANADRTPEQGGARAVTVVEDALSPAAARRLTVTTATPLSPEGLQMVEVTLTGVLPNVLPVGTLHVTVHGHALREGQ